MMILRSMIHSTIELKVSGKQFDPKCNINWELPIILESFEAKKIDPKPAM